MDSKVHLDWETIKIIFAGYKAFIIPILVILVSIAIFLKIGIPQIQGVLNAKSQAREAKQKTEALRTNLNTLSNLDESTLDSQLQILKMALPLSKDFQGVFDSLSRISQKSKVALGNYDFAVGDLSEDEKKSKYPYLELSLVLTGDRKALSNFIDMLDKTTPLSEVTSINMTTAAVTIRTLFYYKTSPSLTHADNVPISPISQKDLSLIKQMEEYTN